jgi:hypothetical protein
MPILKSNEQTTKEYELVEIANLKLLKMNITKYTEKLRVMQREHKLLTGKDLVVF